MEFEVVARCSVTRARVCKMKMAHGETMLPTFMPVATQATMKGVTPRQITELDPPVTLILNNTYHLSQRPGTDILDLAHGAHEYQGWTRNMLTDSGGFQMVSLVKLSHLTEEGVLFANPYDNSKTSLLTPERSMQIQHHIGADIMMQLDDVVSSLTTGARVEEAMERSVRWLDRCIEEHEREGHHKKQNLFAIVQGGLDLDLRKRCLDLMLEPKRRDRLPGYAVGGLSGGEAKEVFWQIVSMSAKRLPEDKPRYCMGVGYTEDILVCVALGIDMTDCVFPTRTARFGMALTPDGTLPLKTKSFARDYSVIDPECNCATCLKGKGLTRSALHSLVGKETVGAHALTLHNMWYMSNLLYQARQAIIEDRFPSFLKSYFNRYFKGGENIPLWIKDAMASVNVQL